MIAPPSMVAGRYMSWARARDACAKSFLSPLLVVAYRFAAVRWLCLGLLRRLEGGEMHSTTLRRLLKEFHGVEVGRYSYGPCLVPGVLPPGTSVGNYCSMADGLRVFRRNHPIDALSQHPFFYNSELGLLEEDSIDRIEDNPLHIGHDVWIGSGVTILPSCHTIGNGAIVGAGSIVTRNVSSFSVCAGNPARFVRERFSAENRELIERSQWWMLSLSELSGAVALLTGPVNPTILKKFVEELESNSIAPL